MAIQMQPLGHNRLLVTILEKHAGALCGALVGMSCWFEVMPCPDGIWQFTVKDEHHIRRAIEELMIEDAAFQAYEELKR